MLCAPAASSHCVGQTTAARVRADRRAGTNHAGSKTTRIVPSRNDGLGVQPAGQAVGATLPGDCGPPWRGEHLPPPRSRLPAPTTADLLRDPLPCCVSAAAARYEDHGAWHCCLLGPPNVHCRSALATRACNWEAWK